MDRRPEPDRLSAEQVHHLGTADPFREPGEVFDVGRRRELTSGGEPVGEHPFKHDRLQVGAGGIDRGRVCSPVRERKRASAREESASEVRGLCSLDDRGKQKDAREKSESDSRPAGPDPMMTTLLCFDGASAAAPPLTSIGAMAACVACERSCVREGGRAGRFSEREREREGAGKRTRAHRCRNQRGGTSQFLPPQPEILGHKSTRHFATHRVEFE